MTPPAKRAALFACWFVVVGALLYACVSSYSRLTGAGADYNVEYMAGQIVASDHPQTLYVDHTARGATYTYIYLPMFAILMVPLAKLPIGPSAFLWYALSVAWTVHSAWLLATGLPGVERHRRSAFVAVLLFLTMAFTMENMFLGQVHALLLWLMTCAWRLLRSGRAAAGASVLAIAAVIKLIPGVFVLYFLLRREWKALAAFAVVFALLGAGLPLLVFGRTLGTELLQGFSAIQIQPYFAAESGARGALGIYHRTAVRKTLHDQDLGALLQRHFTADNGLKDGAKDYTWANLVEWPTATVRKGVFVGFAAFVGITAFVLFGRAGTMLDAVTAIDIQCAVFTVMSLLLAPRNRLCYMTVFLIPFAVVLSQAWLRADPATTRRAWWIIGGTFVLSSLMGVPALRALSVGFYATLWIWAGLLTWYASANRAATRAVPTPTRRRASS